MQADADPLITQQPKGGYQAIESGGDEGIRVESTTSLYSQVREAKARSQGFGDFCLLFCSLLLGSLVWTIVMAITLTLPLAMIIIGATYFHQCQAEPMVPIFNIVGGSVLTISNVINLITRFQRSTGEVTPSRTVRIIGWITTFLNIFLLGWFFAGCYWIYHIYRTADFAHADAKNGCNSTMYFFSYWLLNATFLFFGTVVIASGVTMCLVMICW